MNRQTYATKFTGTVSRTGSRVTRVCPGSPRCLFTGNVWAPSLLGTGSCVFGFGWMVVRFVRVIRLPACARVSRVSRVCPGLPAPPGVFLPVSPDVTMVATI